MEIVDINKERKKKQDQDNEPSPHCKYTDGSGVDWFLFNVTYCYQDKNWNFEIWAKSQEDAELRVSAIKRLPVEVTQTIHWEYQ